METGVLIYEGSSSTTSIENNAFNESLKREGIDITKI